MKKLIAVSFLTLFITVGSASAVNVNDIEAAVQGYLQMHRAVSEGAEGMRAIQKMRGPNNDFTFYVAGSTFVATNGQKQEALAKYLGNLDKMQTILDAMPR